MFCRRLSKRSAHLPSQTLRLQGGSLLCARGAIAHMMHQASGGKVFLVDGNGRWVGG